MVNSGNSSADLDDLLIERYARVVELINVDLLNLRIGMAALRIRLAESGPTSDELSREWEEPLRWVIERGHERVARHIVVGLWVALEVFVEDIFVLVCSGTPSHAEALPKVRVDAGEFMTLSDEDRWRLIWNRAEAHAPGNHGIDRCSYLYGQLGINVDTTVTDVSGAEGTHMENARVKELLRELEAVRNVLVHTDGTVDRRLHKVASNRFTIGTEISIDDDALGEYGLAVHNYAAALVKAASNDLGVG